MSNPLLDKFDELYGDPKEETPEEITEESPNVVGELKLNTTTNSLMVGDGNQYLTVNTSPYISSGITSSSINTLSYTRSYSIPHQTPVEQQFCKVMDNVAQGKATIASISADIDQSFTGFGGQIRYTVEIIGRYP